MDPVSDYGAQQKIRDPNGAGGDDQFTCRDAQYGCY